MKKPATIVKEPRLLVLHEKHETLYFHIPNDKVLFQTALKIVASRLKSDYWYYDPSEDPQPKDPGFIAEQIDAMPVALQSAARNALNCYQHDMRSYRQQVDDYQMIKDAVKKKDGRLAWRVLCDHSDGEYERVSLEHYCADYRG